MYARTTGDRELALRFCEYVLEKRGMPVTEVVHMVAQGEKPDEPDTTGEGGAPCIPAWMSQDFDHYSYYDQVEYLRDVLTEEEYAEGVEHVRDMQMRELCLQEFGNEWCDVRKALADVGLHVQHLGGHLKSRSSDYRSHKPCVPPGAVPDPSRVS